MIRLRQPSLTRKALYAYLMLIVFPFLGISWFLISESEQITKDQVAEALYQLIIQNNETLESELLAVNANTLTLFSDPLLQEGATAVDWQEQTRYRALDRLLGRYHTSILSYSLFVPALGRPISSLPNPMTNAYGVFLFDEQNTEPWYTEVAERRGSPVIKIVPRFGVNPRGELTAAYLRSIRNLETVGVLAVTGLEYALIPHLLRVELPESGEAYLFAEEAKVLVSSAGHKVGAEIKLPVQVREATQGRLFVDDRLYVFTSSQQFGTKLVYEVPEEAIIAPYDAFRTILQYVLLFYLIVLGLFLLFLTRSVLRPLLKLKNAVAMYRPGGGNPITAPVRHDEVGQLYRAFESMTERLEETIQEKYMLELKQKEKELMILHSQITPHLLYNTLDSIYWSGIKGGVPQVAELVKDLSDLLRIGLSKGRDLISLSEELEHLQAYLRLQAKRYNQSFHLHWDIDEQTLLLYVPKVILQPLAENSILHGIGQMDGEGELWIRSVLERGRLIITIEDNGFRPIDVEYVRQLLAHEEGKQVQGYGIVNVHRRIQLHYGECYGLSYSLREGGGTVATLRLPV